jgi:hypothetical protein
MQEGHGVREERELDISTIGRFAQRRGGGQQGQLMRDQLRSRREREDVGHGA